LLHNRPLPDFVVLMTKVRTHSRVAGPRQFSHSAIPTVAGLGWRIVNTTRDRIHCAFAAGTSDGVDWDKRTIVHWPPDAQDEPERCANSGRSWAR
jgi:hypothetical protein